jgi:hypothetical protein
MMDFDKWLDEIERSIPSGLWLLSYDEHAVLL